MDKIKVGALGIFDEQKFKKLASDREDWLNGGEDILLNNKVIPWDQVKADGTYYGSDILEHIVELQYLDSKKEVLNNIFGKFCIGK